MLCCAVRAVRAVFLFFSACPCAASWGRLVGLYFGLGPNCAERGTAKQLGWADGGGMMEGWMETGIGEFFEVSGARRTRLGC